MNDDSRVIDKGWDALPEYGNKSGDADDAVTVSISTTPGEWLVNTIDAVVVPMSMAEVVDALQRHKLTERSLVWRAGMQEWAPVDKVPQLKLAARMHVAPTPSVPPAPSTTPPRPTNSTRPPPKPVRSASAPPSAPAQSAPAVSLPSRKATLPFGLSPPPSAASRPANARPSSPRHAVPVAPPSEEPGVLAVYTRPTATISFDLSPEQPLRADSAPAPVPPQTLAPITTDSAPRRMPPPRNADLSVVAASQFRQVQRSSKRLIWVSSLGSAAAASLLTFWLARSPQTTLSASAARPAQALTPATPAAAVPAAPVAAPSLPSAAPVAEADAEAEVTTPVADVARPKPKAAARKAKAVSIAAAPRAARVDDHTAAAPKDPSAEPNPYDVKLDEDPPAPKVTPETTRSSALEADSKGSEAKATSGSTSPGF